MYLVCAKIQKREIKGKRRKENFYYTYERNELSHHTNLLLMIIYVGETVRVLLSRKDLSNDKKRFTRAF